MARREQRPARRYYEITRAGRDGARGRPEALRGSRPPPAAAPTCLSSCAASSRACRGSCRRGAVASFEPNGRRSSPTRGSSRRRRARGGSGGALHGAPSAPCRTRGTCSVSSGDREMILQDIRFALRLMRLRAGYTAIVIVTLALSIGATTAMFSAIHAVLLRPLPFREPSRLVKVWENDRLNGKPRYAVAPANLRRLAKPDADVRAARRVHHARRQPRGLGGRAVPRERRCRDAELLRDARRDAGARAAVDGCGRCPAEQSHPHPQPRRVADALRIRPKRDRSHRPVRRRTLSDRCGHARRGLRSLTGRSTSGGRSGCARRR